MSKIKFNIFSDIEIYDDLRESLKNDTHSYDIIAMSRYINEIIDSDFYDTVQAMIEKLNQGGWLLLPVRNYRSAYDIYNYISGNTNMPNYINDVSCYNQVEIRTLLQKLNVGKKMLDYEILNVSYNDENIDKIAEGIKIILAVNQLDESLYNNLKYNTGMQCKECEHRKECFNYTESEFDFKSLKDENGNPYDTYLFEEKIIRKIRNKKNGNDNMLNGNEILILNVLKHEIDYPRPLTSRNNYAMDFKLLMKSITCKNKSCFH